MEAKINIAEILKDKPQGTKLYSSACGKCELKEADDKSFKVSFYSSKFGFMNGGEGTFDKNGNLYDDGECIIFPSKEMRDWNKFAWKKGDILVNKDRDAHIVFDKFNDSTYTTFTGRHYLIDPNEYYSTASMAFTESFTLATEDDAKIFLDVIKEKLGDKLNRETLNIEKPAFKIGSLYVFNDEDEDGELTIIGKLVAKDESEDFLKFSYQYEIETEKLLSSQDFDLCISEHKELREATESEASLFESAYTLWKKSKEQPAFKPFDKVLVRDAVDEKWSIDFFECTLDKSQEHLHGCMTDYWRFCIPYNENTKHLLGTTDEWEGGEQ